MTYNAHRSTRYNDNIWNYSSKEDRRVDRENDIPGALFHWRSWKREVGTDHLQGEGGVRKRPSMKCKA